MKKTKVIFVLLIVLFSFSKFFAQEINKNIIGVNDDISFYNETFTLTSRIDSAKVFSGIWKRYYYSYDLSGYLIKSSSIYYKSVKNMQTFFVYDSVHNLILKRSEIFKDNKWVNNLEETYTYLPNVNTSSWVLRKWEDSLWVNIDRKQYAYDENGNTTLYSEEHWFDNSWIIQERNTYIYDDGGKKTSFLNEWRIIGGDLENNIKESYEYDNNNNLILFTKESWWGQQWLTIFKKSLSYYIDNNIAEEVWEHRVDTILVNDWKVKYTYDENKRKVLSLFENWKNNKWNFSNKNSFSYNSDGKNILILGETWHHNQWENERRETMIYNIAGYMQFHLRELWETNHWENSIRNSYIFDSNNNMTKYSSESWYSNMWNNNLCNISLIDSLGNQYSHHGLDVFLYYDTATDIKGKKELNTPKEYGLSQNYPNPFNPTTTISYSLPQSGFVQLKVYNMLGQEIAVLVNKEKKLGNYKLEFNASSLSSGVYFYRLQSGNFTETKKLVLLR